MISIIKMKYNKYLTEEDEDFNDPLRDYAEGVDCLDLDCSDSVEYDDDVEDDGLEDWSDEEYDDTLDSEEFNEGWVWVDDEEDDEEDEDDPDPFTLVGVDGNIFAVIGYVADCMRQVHCDSYEIDAFRREVTHQDSYDSALRMCCEQVDECNKLYHEQQRDEMFDNEFDD